MTKKLNSLIKDKIMKKFNLIVILFTFIHFVAFSQQDSVYTELITSKEEAMNVYHLDLSQHFKYFGHQLPDEIKNYNNIETIKLGDIFITHIPKWVGKLKSLKTISFNNQLLECASQERLKEFGVVNPNENEDYDCYAKVSGIASSWGTPVMAGVSINDTLCIINIKTRDMLFKNIDELRITPCGLPIILVGRTVFFPPSSYDEFTTRDVFYEYNFPADIKKIKLEHCEGGIHKITLKNSDTYFFNNRLPIIVKKGQKKIEYYGEKNDCEKIIDQIDDKWYELKQILEQYYFYSDCSKKRQQRATEQVELINHLGQYYKWDFNKQDIAAKEVRAYPVKMNESKQKECLEIMNSWEQTNEGQDNLPIEIMDILEKNGCLRIELLD